MFKEENLNSKNINLFPNFTNQVKLDTHIKSYVFSFNDFLMKIKFLQYTE